MTILGWQLNTWSDAAFHFVFGYQIVNFRILVVPFSKALFFVVANYGYFTVFTPHIYFRILISMIAGNLVEIRLKEIQSRKCLQKFNSNEIRSPELSVYHLLQPKECFPIHDVWNILFHFSLSYLWPFVGCGAFSLCNWFLSVSRAAPLTLKNKLTGQWIGPFLCLNCFTNTLKYYWKNYRFRKAQNWS